MTKTDIVKALQRKAENQAFITCKEVADALGCADQHRVRNKYLTGLEAVDKKYYLITDVAAVLKSRAQPT